MRAWIHLLGPALAGAMLLGPLLAQDPAPYPQPDSKKGLQVQMVDDALALGIRHATLNLVVSRMLDLDGGDDAVAFEHGDRTWHFHRPVIEALDRQVQPLSDAGVVISVILLAARTGDPTQDAWIVHPGCSASAPPNGWCAFQTTTEDGRAWLDAAITFLAARYSGAAPHGRIWNWIVGNEVNSHWWWYHLGRAPMAAVVEAYERAVRIVHDAVTRQVANARVFVSLEHHWTQRYAAGDAQQAFPGRDFLLAFAARVRARGDFGWHVAFHPYPENLFDCHFWRDQSATAADDSPRVTFRNLPVLLRFLGRDELLWRGASRRVILSEQGFHCGDGEHGERDQAAAFALAWSIVDRLDGIDAFILHRHVDHAHEGGLRLGLWARVPDSVCTPARRRRMAFVFAQCDTEAWPECAALLLPVVGLQRFDDFPLAGRRE